MAREKGKLSGLKTDGSPNAHWRKFKERLDQHNSVPVENWTAENILGYLLSKYKTHYQVDWTLSYSGSPSKCAEMYAIRRMMAALSIDNEKIKEYIDWVFSTIIKDGFQLKSIGLFFTPDVINRFKTQFKKSKRITRSTQLPSDLESITGMLIMTYGDLAFAKMAIESSPEDYPEYAVMFEQLRANGFDETVLEFLE